MAPLSSATPTVELEDEPVELEDQGEAEAVDEAEPEADACQDDFFTPDLGAYVKLDGVFRPTPYTI